MGRVVNGTISVYAFASPNAPDWCSPSSSEPGQADEVRAAGEYFVVEYESLALLVDQILGIQNGLKGKPCLRVLELHAHGSPCTMNGFMAAYADDIDLLAKPRWSDDSSLYLSGCNTGLTDPQSTDPRWGAVPIAQVIANAIPRAPKAFRFTVFGTVGYSHGCHALGTTQTWAVGGVSILGLATYHYAAPFTGGQDTEPDPTLPDPAAPAYKAFRGPNSA